MPLYTLACENGHTTEEYCHVPDDKGTRTHICHCGHSMSYALSMGHGLTYFEEGRGRWIHNLAHEPVYVTSHAQHQQLMKQHGVEWCTGWNVRKTGGWT